MKSIFPLAISSRIPSILRLAVATCSALRVFRQGHQQIGEQDFRAGRFLAGDVLVNFGFTHLNAALNVTLAQALLQQFIAEIAAVVFEPDAFLLQALCMNCSCDILLEPAMFWMTWLSSASETRMPMSSSAVDLQALQNQALEHLALEDVVRR